MRREMIRIDEEKCTGCGQCVTACEEGALDVIDGKARLVREIYCDGLGACIGECPEDALTIETVEAEAFDPDAVERHLAARGRAAGVSPPLTQDNRGLTPPARHAPGSPGGCPGAALRSLDAGQASGQLGRAAGVSPPLSCDNRGLTPPARHGSRSPGAPPPSALGHWPVQLRLVPPTAPFLQGADLLVCADCVPFAVPDFHDRYLKGRAVLVGCPKLDDLAFYQEKLKDVFAQAKPASLTVLRMEVPCCAGIAMAALEARKAVCPDLPVDVHVVGIRGGIEAQGQMSCPAAGGGSP